ncbi:MULTISPECIES: hypothetical protein [unclassified Pseudomonas]|uniref:hypothetical protein n=1 Tax=unclassified Pseudomonas TaxID=196821 RepID=UPI000C87DD37|nr:MULTISPECIES: hypothetical protein [unclassified Pseudomonas]PMX29318.1 hypothetical protein C1Y23_01870 [Pseudomonas sp. GW460-12]PMX32726.1 hypothetical protein C1Y24_19830 [Pseudomonas sp. MPR-R2A4]PMX40318.1 hypothetical protein C1Y26_15225 [Pseudomonas sp. MPR-R2A7]PMX52776.1 hypothetical protein C1Y17_16900 [Pseudomonas sp. MPR-R2A6]PMX89969.1 hypothetical protein C1Y21_18180 [Pseudomonas sp. MPR-R2A3]
MQFHGFVFGHIEVEIHDRAYDLHNFYQAGAIIYDIVDRSIVLSFTRRSDSWVPTEEARKITISFHEVDYFSASGRDENLADSDGNVLHSIGVVESGAETQTFYLTDNIQPDHHLVIRFESGLTLRVQAAEARCEIVF